MAAATFQANDTTTMLDVARAYQARAWCVIPVPYRTKKPVLEDWPNLRLTDDELVEHFGQRLQNAGLLLGLASGGLTDVDLDALEAVQVGQVLLPPTQSVFGRRSKPRSHYLYACDPLQATERLKDFDGTTLVELRSTGAQTIVPPSVHPTGEAICWHHDGAPTVIDGRILRGHVRRTGAAALLARHWPAVGSRHDASLALAGGLLRAGWSEDDVASFVVAVADAAGDDEAVQRGENVRTTARRLGSDGAATGWRTLSTLLGAEVVDRVREWLELRDRSASLRLSRITGGVAVGAAPGPWPEPERRLNLPSAPALDLSLFPPEIANVSIDAAERLQCPADYVAWGLAVCLAGLIGRQVGIRPRQHDDWTERPCLWVALIGEPSWMKSPALDVARRPLKRQDALDHERYRYELVAWQAECDALRAAATKGRKPKLPPKPSPTRRLTSDATIEKLADLMGEPEDAIDDAGDLRAPSPGLTLIRDEIAGWVGAFNRYARAEGDRQFFLECYSGGPYTVDRVNRGTVRVPDTYLNILGGAQPDRARDIFGEGPDDGLAARVTAIYPHLPPTWKEVDRWPDGDARRALDAVSDRLVAAEWESLLPSDEWRPLPYCRLDPGAGELWSDWHRALMEELRGGTWEGRHAGRVGKYPGLAARLMLVWHLVEWAAGRVPDDMLGRVPMLTTARALNLMDHYVRPMDERVYRAFDRTAAATGAERIARWIVEMHPASFTLRDIRRHEWSGLSETSEVAAAVEWLASKGWVREADPEQRVGRPANRYVVNPGLREGAA